MMTKQRGFTLIELLIVVGIIGILAAAIIVAITPGERLQEAREAARNAHKQAIAMAVHMAVIDGEHADVAALLTALNCSSGGDVDTNCAGDLDLPRAPIVAGTESELYVITADGGRVKVKCKTTTGNGCDETVY